MQFFHYSKWPIPDVRPGSEYSTASFCPSDYWRFGVEGRYPDGVTDPIIAEALALFPSEMKHTALKLGAMKRQAQLDKELTFEEVRQEHYPNQPSRVHCIFGFPLSVDHESMFIRLGFEISGYNLLIITPKSNEHKVLLADSSLLNCNAEGKSQWKNNAHKYWQGVDKDNPNVELLFEGSFFMSPV